MKLLFVCLGNICRSPAGENVMRHMLKEAGLETIYCGGYTPDFSVSPRLFKTLNYLFNIIPFMYKFHHVVLAKARKPV